MTTALLTRTAPAPQARTLPAATAAVAAATTSAATTSPAAAPRDTSAVEVSASLPFHVLVGHAQRAEREGRTTLWITGPGAPAVASRLLRLTNTLTVGAELDLSDGAAAAALDAVALARVADGRAHVLVRDVRHLPALARELGQRPRPRLTRFGGDAFAATLPGSSRQEVLVTAVVTHQGEVVAALPYAHALLVLAPTGVDAHALVRRARAAGEGWPQVGLRVAVPATHRPAAWPHGDGVVRTRATAGAVGALVAA